MADVPSVKGSVLAGHAEVLTKYLASHPVDPAILSRRFRPGEVELLAGPINTIRWYDVGIYERVLEFLRDYPGEGDNAYLLAAGTRSAEALIRAGFYQQMEYLRRTQVSTTSGTAERFQAFGRDLRLLASITQSILNFSVATAEVDPEHSDRWMVRHQSRIRFPEVLCWTTQGFNNRMAEEHGSPELWRFERQRDDLVHFRMNYSL